MSTIGITRRDYMTNTEMSSTISGPIAPSKVIGRGSGFRLLLREHLEPAQVEFAAA